MFLKRNIICIVCTLALFFSVFPTLDAAVVIKTKIPTDGLVGYWKMDEGTGSTVVDSSGNGHDGSLSGATWVNDRRQGKALQFSGLSSDDEVDLGTDSDLNPEEFTISGLINIDSLSSSYDYIYSTDRDCCEMQSGISLWVSQGRVYSFIWNATTTPTVVSSTQVLVPGTWYHLASTYDGSVFRLYINGHVVSSIEYDGGVGTPATFNASLGTMGSSQGTYTLAGKLDEVRLYNRALSQSEMTVLYNLYFPNITNYTQKVVSTGGPIDFDFEDTTVGTCPEGWTCTGDAAVASSGDGQGCVAAGSVQGSKYLKAGCDGPTGRAYTTNFKLPVGIDHITFLRAGGADTGGFYVKQVVGDSVLCSSENGTDNDTFFADSCSGLSGYGNVLVYIDVVDNTNSGWGKTYVDDIQFKNSSEDLLSLVQEGTGIIAHYTFDGSSVTGDTVRDVSGRGNHGTRNPELYGPGGEGWTISGASYYPEFNGEYFLCTECGTSYGKPIYKMGDYYLWYEEMEYFDEWSQETYIDTYWYLSYIDLWNWYYMGWGSYVVGDGYEYGSPCDWPDAPGCMWDDGITATELVDAGPVLGGVNKWAVPGKMGQAMTFNGTSEYVSIPNQDMDVFSVSLWLKRSRLGAQWGSFGCNPNCDRLIGGSNNAWGIAFNADDQLFLTKIGVSGVTSDATITDTTNWHQVVVTYDGSNVRFYIDGVLEDTESYAVTFSSSGDYAIGTVTNSLNQYFGGLMDDVRIYRTVLTATEVANLYSKTNNNKLVVNSSQNNKSTDGLVGLWSFNGPDISGDTAYDRSGEGNEGTLTNGPKVAIGKVGQALQFNGTNYVTVGNDSALNPSDEITVSTWIKQVDTNPIANLGGLVSLWSSNEDYRSYLLYALNPGDEIRFNINGPTEAIASVDFSRPVWHHVVGTYDGSSVKIYVDGVLEDSTPYSNPINPNNTEPLEIGRFDQGPEFYFNGLIDDSRIYDRALSADEVQKLYMLGK